MHKILFIIVMAIAFTVSGCASTGSNDTVGRLAIQYATLKVIEQSDSITAEGVIEHVDRVRAVLDADADEEVALVDLRQEVLDRIDMTRLDAADRLLVLALLDQVEMTLATDVETGILDEDAKARVGEVLDWVESAAGMA